MPTPTDDRRAPHLSTPHLEQFKSVMADLLDEKGLTIAQLKRIA